jgi:hypothetical protein
VKDVNGLGGQPGAGAHGWSTATGARMISPKDEPKRVDQK